METLEQQIFPDWLEQLQSCPQEYPASQVPLPGSAEARMMTAGSGRQCSMLFEESNPLGYCSKILLESSAWTSSQEYCYVWERLDTRFGLSAFQLTPLEQSTDDNGSSLLGTPNAREAGPNGQVGCLRQTIEAKLWPTPTDKGNYNRAGLSEKAGNGLATAAKLWPTPTVIDAESGGRSVDYIKEKGTNSNLRNAAKLWPTPCAQEDGKSPEAHLAMKARMKGGPRYTVTSLNVAAKLWPTPTERDWKSTSHGNQGNSRPLSEVAGLTGQGSLNPEFVEVLMGFPIGHTRLRASESPIEATGLKPWATR
jgi:hypothetical protein